MIGTMIVFVVGMLVGAAGRNQVAEAARFAGNKVHDIVKPADTATNKPDEPGPG